RRSGSRCLRLGDVGTRWVTGDASLGRRRGLAARSERRRVRRALHFVTELLRRIDRLAAVVRDVDREAGHAALVSTQAASGLERALPRLGLDTIALRRVAALERT